MSPLLTVLLTVVVSVYGSRSGTTVSIETTPWLVSLHTQHGFFCNAVIITPKHALTTANCVQNLTANARVWARVGSTSFFVGGQLKYISNVLIHEDFNQPNPLDNDIALLTFKYQLPARRADIQRIYIASPEVQLRDNQSLVVTGWPLPVEEETDSDSPFPAFPAFPTMGDDRLIANELFSVDHEECISAHEENGSPTTVNENMICGASGPNGNEECRGSPGSPLYVYGVTGPLLLGLWSWDYGCGAESPPEVFTRINSVAVLEWLVGALENQGFGKELKTLLPY